MPPRTARQPSHRRSILFMGFVAVMVLATLVASFFIALHHVQVSDHETGMATESILTRHYDEALIHYNRALDEYAKNRQAWSGRALTLMYLERYNEALWSYDRVIRLKPEDAQGWHGRGMSLEELGRYDEALDSYNRAIELSPAFGLAVRQRDRLLDNQPQLREP